MSIAAMPEARWRSQRSGFVFLIPSALMRDASVVGFMPNKTAAPSGPKILPFVSRKACMMFSCSCRLQSCRVATCDAVRGDGEGVVESREGAG